MAAYDPAQWDWQYFDPQLCIDPAFLAPGVYTADTESSRHFLTNVISSPQDSPETMSKSTSPSPGTQSDVSSGEVKVLESKKRHRSSGGSQSGALIRPRKTRKLLRPDETAKVREKGACFLCQKRGKRCENTDDPDGPCQRCLIEVKKICVPGLLNPVCWRPNIGSTEVFRRGPTIDFAASLRGNIDDAGAGKQALWKKFDTKRHGNEMTRTVELSQYWTSDTLKIPLDRYRPKETDKQHYSWYDDGVEKRYVIPPYGISDLAMAGWALERFLIQNFDEYIEAHLRSGNEITRKTFQAAQTHRHLPLVESALRLWVACRFICTPWSIVGSDTLDVSLDTNPNCPYHTRIPVPPIVDLQIDLVVINTILQPEMKKILEILKKKLKKDPWTDWFEIYLANFILLHNVELTMAHDAWFVRHNHLKTRYSNKPLIDTITQGATTLLTCFHYAHQGYAPFSNPELEKTQPWTEAQRAFLREIRPMLQRMRGDHSSDPAEELFWTSQLHRPDWRPVVLAS